MRRQQVAGLVCQKSWLCSNIILQKLHANALSNCPTRYYLSAHLGDGISVSVLFLLQHPHQVAHHVLAPARSRLNGKERVQTVDRQLGSGQSTVTDDGRGPVNRGPSEVNNAEVERKVVC